jgi:hypothetical protein
VSSIEKHEVSSELPAIFDEKRARQKPRWTVMQELRGPASSTRELRERR